MDGWENTAFCLLYVFFLRYHWLIIYHFFTSKIEFTQIGGVELNLGWVRMALGQSLSLQRHDFAASSELNMAISDPLSFLHVAIWIA